MHRSCGRRSRPAVLPFLAVVWALAIHAQPATASGESPRTAHALPATGANVVGTAPYLGLGMALIRSRDTRFVDGEAAGHAALYGSEEHFDAGALDNAFEFRLAAGVRLPYRLRAQIEFGLARALDWRGNTNYVNSGEHQPSAASVDTQQVLLAAFHDFPGWKLASGRRVQPFLGAGLGITNYRLSDYVQGFPEPDAPDGYLRRGPDREIPFTALPGGRGRNLTWMLTAGAAIPIGGSTHLDLSYRYTDAGAIRTDIGDITIVRYREDGTRREIAVPINETSADHRTHALLVALRYEF